MASETPYLSHVGLEQAKAQLRQLIEEERPANIERIATAKGYGDLSENGDYEAARNEQAFLEGRILALEALIREAVIIEEPTDNRFVGLGSTVTVRSDVGVETYVVVGRAEAKPNEGRISNESPLGRALLGKSLGDIATVMAPGGRFDYEITEIA